MKKIGIYFSDPEPMGYPLSSERYFEAYADLVERLEKIGIVAFITRGDGYLGKGTFSKGWQIENNELIDCEGPITVDLILNRGRGISLPNLKDWPIINHPDFDALCLDKVKTAELFPEISPQTAALSSFNECCQILQTWDIDDNQLIVLKKNFGEEGNGVFIIPKKDIDETLYEEWSDILMQEFIDSSCGIPGLTEGLHDLRVNLINGTPIKASLRIPKEGSFIANVAQGGNGYSIPLASLPDEIFTYTDVIYNKIKIYNPTIMAADFVHSTKGYRLIELNSRPAVSLNRVAEDKTMNEGIVELLSSYFSRQLS